MKNQIIKQPVFWVGLDYYYGLGFGELKKRGFLKNFTLICLDNDPVISHLRKQGLKIYSLEEDLGPEARKLPRNTGHLLSHPRVIKLIKKESGKETPAIAFFKPSLKIDLLLKKMNWKAIGNLSSLNKFWENKISFYIQTKKLSLPVPDGEIVRVGPKDFDDLAKKWGSPFLLQFASGWAGKSSFLIKKDQDLKAILGQERREIKITTHLTGKTIINNACLLPDGQILIGSPGWQITGQPPFTNNPLSTCGREWRGAINDQVREEIYQITQKLGKEMFRRGYRGFFGLDFLINEKGAVFLLECNPRLTASFVFYNYLEIEEGLSPILFCHLKSFLFPDQKIPLTRRDYLKFYGGELIQRNITKQELVIKKAPLSGMYSLSGKLLGTEFFSTSKKKAIIISPSLQKKISPGNELLRITTKRRIINKKGQVDPTIVKLKDWLLEKKLFFKNGYQTKA